MTSRILIALAALVFGGTIRAEAFLIGTQPVSLFADSEVSTNIVLNARRNDTKCFELRLEFKAGDGNSVQVAFGCDADGDGDLAAEETSLIIGRIAGEYVIEDVSGGVRHVASSDSASSGGYLDFKVITDGDYRPQELSVWSESGSPFAMLSAQDWMYDVKWNMAKITRRGVDIGSETCSIDNQYRAMMMLFR